MLNSRLSNLIPPKPYLVLGNRMFLLSMVILVICTYIYDVGEAFVAVEVGIIHFLYNLKFGRSRTTLFGALYPLLMTLIAVPLSVVPMPYAPFTSAAFVFLLVLLERDSHHQGVPSYILPLTFLLLSMMMPVDIPTSDLMVQRAVSVLLGVSIAVMASTLLWRNQVEERDQKPKRKVDAIDLKYSSRKALGVGLILSLGLLGGSGAALGAYLFMMLHSPISKQLAPKAWQRLSGTVVGALVYLPIGLLLGYMTSPLMVSIAVWILVIISLYMILVCLEHNYTIATAFIMLLILTVAVGPFNVEMIEAVFSQRFAYTVVGGASMIILGMLLPINENELTTQ